MAKKKPYCKECEQFLDEKVCPISRHHQVKMLIDRTFLTKEQLNILKKLYPSFDQSWNWSNKIQENENYLIEANGVNGHIAGIGRSPESAIEDFIDLYIRKQHLKIRKTAAEIIAAGAEPFVFVFSRAEVIDICCAIEMELTRGLDKTKPEDMESDTAYLDSLASTHAILQEKLNG